MSKDTTFPKEKEWEMHSPAKDELLSDIQRKNLLNYARKLFYAETIFNQELNKENGDAAVNNDGKRVTSVDLLSLSDKEKKRHKQPKAFHQMVQRLRQYGRQHNKEWKLFKLVAMKSKRGCLEQAEHTDGVCNKNRKNKDIGSVVFSIMDGTKLVIEGKEVNIPVDSALVFAGCLLHNGAAYDTENIRFHAYYAREKSHILKDSVGRVYDCPTCGERGVTAYHIRTGCAEVPAEVSKPEREGAKLRMRKLRAGRKGDEEAYAQAVKDQRAAKKAKLRKKLAALEEEEEEEGP